jgi:translin
VDPEAMISEFQGRFDSKMAAREAALPAARQAIRHCANAIRAIHREEFDKAESLMDQARASLDQGVAAAADFPDIYYAGYLQDAEKEYAEARTTYSVVRELEVPGPEDIGVGVAPYLNGISEAIGEARRHILDLLRKGEFDRSERLLSSMDDIYFVLVSMDYPDAITGNLRRSTDIARGILEKTRGDLSLAIVQRNHRDALEGLGGSSER